MTKTTVKEFKSLGEFKKFIDEMPVNSVFQNKASKNDLHSVTGSYSFTQTSSYEEAVGLFQNGWTEMAKKLDTGLKVKTAQLFNDKVRRSQYDVVGGNCSVPRYLQGIPTAMINQKTVVKKQKIVNIYKDISYSAMHGADTIMEESVKALEIVRRIEAGGARVNLFVVLGTEADGHSVIFAVKIKGADERLNISKLAFPLVHPSMLRRLYFRLIEVAPCVKEKGFEWGYGKPVKANPIREALKIDDQKIVYLETFISNVEAKVAQITGKKIAK